MDTNGWAESADTADGGSADFSAVRQNAKLILRADLTLETQDFDAASADLEKLTAETGGYIESSSLSGDKGSRSAYYTLRIPQEKFETFYAQLGDRAHVVYSSRSSEDITEQYTDIETRLATLQTKHERLLALLDQAGKMEDIISLENALADCEYEIDSLTGSKRHYDDLVGFSTFSVTLDEVQTLTATPEGSGFGAQLTQAAKPGPRAHSRHRHVLAGRSAARGRRRRSRRDYEKAPEKARGRVGGAGRTAPRSARKGRKEISKKNEGTGFTGAFVLLFCVFRLVEQLLRVDAEQLRQREQIGCARVGRAALPLGYRLPAHADRLRDELLRHFTRRAVLLQHSAERFRGLGLFRPDGRGAQIFPQRPDQQHEHIDGYAHDGEHRNDRIQRHYHGNSSFSALSIIEKPRLRHQLSRNRSKKS